MDNTSNSRINRINYIVQENPSGVSQTLVAEGFNPSTDVNTLIQQTKQWIQQDGKAAVVKLLKVHPEKDAILSANKPAYENFGGCGCKSSFDGSACACKDSFDGSPCPCQGKSSYNQEYDKKLEKMSKKELHQHYKELKRLLKQFPEDKELREEIEIVWEQLNYQKKKHRRTSKSTQEKSKSHLDSKTVFTVNSKDLAVGSLIFGLALIISQIK